MKFRFAPQPYESDPAEWGLRRNLPYGMAYIAIVAAGGMVDSMTDISDRLIDVGMSLGSLATMGISPVGRDTAKNLISFMWYGPHPFTGE